MQSEYTELTDSQWQVMNNLLPTERKRKYNLRDIVNGIFWLHRTGCQWRNLPPNFPPWKSVYYYFRRWTHDGIWQSVNDWLVELERECQHKEVEASLMCGDSQSVKLGPFIKEDRGYDGNKKINGRKRHILVDTLGLIIGVLVTAANVADGKAGCLLLNRCSDKFGRLKKILVDGVYAGTFMDYATKEFNIEVEISSRPPTSKGFVPIKKRWVNERTFGWFNFFRRLDKDHEKSTKSSESMILIANIQIIFGRFDS
jgi:putative transposase